MIDSGVDLAYPVLAEVELALNDARREPGRTGGLEQVSAGSVAHQLVTAALASRDYGRAEHAARVARELLPGDETAALDLARVLDAQGRVEQARAVLKSFAHRDRITPVDERE
jgi:hypothetical protein